jgi:protein ImuA
MSQSGVSERILFLRRTIAALAGRGPETAPEPRADAGATTGDLERLFSHCRRGACEIVPARPKDAAAAAGFALALALRCARLRPEAGVVWIAEDMVVREIGLPYGRGLQAAGLAPERLVLARTRRPPETLWAMEEALKSAPAAVVAESWASGSAYGLTASRRLVLAARRSGAAGLLLLPRAAGEALRLASAAEARFEIASSFALRSEGGPRPLPGPCVFRLRVAKARGFFGAFDPQAWRDIVFDPERAEFRHEVRHALPRRVPAAPFDRPDLAEGARARAR